MKHNLFGSLQQFKTASGVSGEYYSLPALEKAAIAKVSDRENRSAGTYPRRTA